MLQHPTPLVCSSAPLLLRICFWANSLALFGLYLVLLIHRLSARSDAVYEHVFCAYSIAFVELLGNGPTLGECSGVAALSVEHTKCAYKRTPSQNALTVECLFARLLK